MANYKVDCALCLGKVKYIENVRRRLSIRERAYDVYTCTNRKCEGSKLRFLVPKMKRRK